MAKYSVKTARAIKDLIGGTLVFLLGFGFFVQSFSYGIGFVTQMRAGYFPMVLGVITMIVALAIMLPAFRRLGSFRFADGIPFEVAWRPMVAILGAVAMFALTIERFGLILAVAFTVVFAALGDSKSRPLQIFFLTICACFGLWLIFSVGLGVPVPAFKGFY